MNAVKILQSAGLDPSDAIFSLDNKEAVERNDIFLVRFSTFR